MKIAIILALELFVQTASAISAPSISSNALFLFRDSNFHSRDADPANVDTEPNGLSVREAELQFYADVDPYTQLNLVLAIHPQISSNGTEIDEKWVIEPEEAFVDSISIQAVTLRAGKFKAIMGKHNTLHTHAFPFIKGPLANEFLLGDEGLNDFGVSASWLLELPWFSELTVQYLRGKGENTEFRSPRPNDGVALVHYKNLIDLNDDLTLELGLSHAQGKNSYREMTQLNGGDLTFKWRPADGGKYYSFLWATEYLLRTQGQTSLVDEKGFGIASWLQYQFAERWMALYRYDNIKFQNSYQATAVPNGMTSRNSFALAFNASDFSTIKIEFDQKIGLLANANGQTTENSIYVQANFLIGSHPSHKY